MKFLVYRKMLVMGFLFLGVSARAMVMQLPGAENIVETIDTIMGYSFSSETALVDRLACKQMTVENVVSEVQGAVSYYAKSQKNPLLRVNAEMNAVKLIKAILRDCPGAREELRRLRVIR